ncbi:MAG: hypothetical protein K9G67_07405 [Bacteroidales bacterium]|nr:hypothetical protein [Bacteroidales bacterium]MCF8343623.1 hypothetical protein [Bacteroidales bacterium]MCF8350109.1 hypothetical protein [Bacteroidales bacterium]MCF8376167.1 hypothetical protein [Bacteroidales bacterium]
MAAEKEIELLREQIAKLEKKDFDLKAWKNYTTIILGRIFGEDSRKIDQIRNIEYMHGSWSLRDTSGDSAIEACKKLGREILEASVSELENFGAPKTGSESNEEIVLIITEALQDELKGSQYKELVKILNDKGKTDEKKDKIFEKLRNYGSETANTILSNILANPKIGKEIK